MKHTLVYLAVLVVMGERTRQQCVTLFGRVDPAWAAPMRYPFWRIS